MSRSQQAGFALLEVVVALGVLTISTLAIAQALGAAIEYSRAAAAARRATAVAATIAHAFDDRTTYPAGWRVVGAPGPDGVPGTRDDTPPDGSQPTCWSRIDTSALDWVRIEASCADRDGPGVGATAPPVGGRLGSVVSLVRVR